MKAISRKLLSALSNHFWFGITGSSYISVALLVKGWGLIRVNQYDKDYLVKPTSSLVKFCGGDATFCQITAYTYSSAAVWPKTCVNSIVPVNNDVASVS